MPKKSQLFTLIAGKPPIKVLYLILIYPISLLRSKSWFRTFNNLNVNEKIFVAENSEGNIIGFSSGGRNRYDDFKHDGEVYTIYLLKDYQKLSIGKMLFDTVVESLRENGYSSMMLWVIRANPSVAFYKALGGQIIGQKTITRGRDSLDEVAIGWDII